MHAHTADIKKECGGVRSTSEILWAEILISRPSSIDYLISFLSFLPGGLCRPRAARPAAASFDADAIKSRILSSEYWKGWAILRWKQKFFFNFSWRLVTETSAMRKTFFHRERHFFFFCRIFCHFVFFLHQNKKGFNWKDFILAEQWTF